MLGNYILALIIVQGYLCEAGEEEVNARTANQKLPLAAARNQSPTKESPEKSKAIIATK